MISFAKWLEHTFWVTTLSNTPWMYSTCEVAHYFSLFVLVGMIVVVDLRILGIATRRRSAVELAALVFPWANIALGVVIVSGFLMFTTDADRYVSNKVFFAKLFVMLLAIISSLAVFRDASKSDLSAATPFRVKLTAVVSLALWIGTIIVAVEIPAITGVG